MKYTEFMHITYHTALSESVREKLAKAYGRGERTVIVNDLTIQDARVLTNLGYNIKHRNKKMEIQL
jgi:ribosomal protein S24E